MHRIDGPGAVNRQFAEGDPSVPQMATVVTAAWLNDVQGNIAKAIEAAGIELVKGDYNQLAQAIQAQTVGSIRDVYAGMIVQWEAEAIPELSDGLPLGLELDGAVADLSVYPRLARKLCGQAVNATAPAWYRCTPSGTRDVSGGYIRLQDRRGEFVRGWDHGRGMDASRILGSAQPGTLMHYPYLVRSPMSYSPSMTNTGPTERNLDGYVADTSSSYYVQTATDTGAGTTGEGRVRPNNVASMHIVLV